MSGLRRAALVFGILALLLWADGAYLIAKHTSVHGDSGVLFGNSHDYLSAGTVVVLSGVLVLAASAIMWCADVHREDKERERRLGGRTAPHAPAGDPPTHEQPGPSGRTASHA
jgi:hypothetical protein